MCKVSQDLPAIPARKAYRVLPALPVRRVYKVLPALPARRATQGLPAHWGLREEPLELAALMAREASPQRCLLVDCLTLWLSNLLFAGEAARQAEAGEAVCCPLLQGQTQALVELLPTLPGHIILVSNEVGWGIVPMHPVSRLFGDEQGRLNQRVGAACEQVTLVAAGLPLSLKAPGGSAA